MKLLGNKISLESSGDDELVDGGVNKLVEGRLDTNSDSVFLTHGDFGDNMMIRCNNILRTSIKTNKTGLYY